MRGDGPGCSFESRTRSRSPISARMAALWSELRLRAFRMKSTSQVVAPPRRKYAGAGIRSGRKYKSELKAKEPYLDELPLCALSAMRSLAQELIVRWSKSTSGGSLIGTCNG